MTTAAKQSRTPLIPAVARVSLLSSSILLVASNALAQRAALEAASNDKAGVNQSVANFRANQDAVNQRDAAKHFTVVTPGTVKDSRTGLVWMRCSLGQDWDEKAKACTGNVNVYTWKGAVEITERLNAVGGYAGSTNWRVPTMRELQSLRYCSTGFFTANEYMLERGKGVPKGCNPGSTSPTIAKSIFPGMDSERLIYFSSSGADQIVPLISFETGIIGNGEAEKNSAVRLVR